VTQEQEERTSFLKKRSKKLLRVFTRDIEKSPGGKLSKVFCFFFSKKKFFLPVFPSLDCHGWRERSSR